MSVSGSMSGGESDSCNISSSSINQSVAEGIAAAVAAIAVAIAIAIALAIAIAIAIAIATASAAVDAIAAIAAVATLAIAGATATRHKAAQAKAAQSNGHSHTAGCQDISSKVCCQFHLQLPCTTHAPPRQHNNDNDGTHEEDHGSNTNICKTQHMCLDHGTQLHAAVHNNTPLQSHISAPDDVRLRDTAVPGNDTHAVHVALPHCCLS